MLTSLLALVASSYAGTLDLTATGSVGCDPQWYGNCLANPVWGSNIVLGIATPQTVPVLTVGASSTATTKIGIADQALNGYKSLSFEVTGKALTANTKISVETKFLDSAGNVVSVASDPLHSGSAGMFSVSIRKTSLPSAAVHWRSRLVVEDDAAAFTEVVADCFWASGCTGSPGPGTEDNGDHGCEECGVDCGDYTALGVECDDSDCTASCDGDEDDVEFQAGVDLSP